MSRLKQLVHEIHRRSLWQVLLIYGMSAWAILAAVDTLAGALGLPDWAARFAFFLLVVGLPIVLATAFVQEGIGGQEKGAAADPAPSEPGDPRAEERATGGARRRLLSWRNALLGGVGAFALLGLVTAGYMAMRTLGIGPAGTLVARGVLEERDPILLADFEGADPVLARTVTEALRIDLAGSEVVSLISPGALQDALARMLRDPDEPLTMSLAREVAIREGIKAVLGGSINPAGSGFVLSAELVEPENADVLIPLRATAANPDDVIPAIEDLSRTLLERIGESLRSLQSRPPLARATTSSLDALQLLTQANQAMSIDVDRGRARALLEEAVAIDSTFAMAYRRLAALDNGRAAEYLARGVRYEARLTDIERYRFRGMFEAFVAGDLEAAIAAFRRANELDPDSVVELNNLAAVYRDLRRYEEAEEALDRLAVRQTGGENVTNLMNRFMVEYALGKTAEARATLERAAAETADQPLWHLWRFHLAAAEGEYDEAETRLDTLARRFFEPAFDRGRLAAIHGRLADAERWFQADYDGDADVVDARRTVNLADRVTRLRVVAGDLTGGRRLAREILEEIETLPGRADVARDVAELWARLGEPVEARAALEVWNAQTREYAGPHDESDSTAVEAHVALSENRPEDAVRLFRHADRVGSPIALLDDLGLAYDSAGVADSVIAVYERYLDTPWFQRLADDAYARGPILERLAQLYDERGDPESAAKYYAMFVELWEDADPQLQPRVQAAQSRLEEILTERG